MRQTTRDRDEAAESISQANSLDDPVVVELQRQVGNAFLLYSNYKRYHWQCYGPLFRDLHRLFDELAGEVLETLDPLAERVRMIGPDPVAGPVETMQVASVKPTGMGYTMREMVEEADQNLIGVIREMRDAFRVADQRDDPGTADLFARIVQVHEKHEWWLRDILEGNDGFLASKAVPK
jgi:starvation-inducible DNA-binding protein